MSKMHLSWTVAGRATGCMMALGCSAPEYELFAQTRAEMARDVGNECAIADFDATGVTVVTQSGQCGAGVCLGIGPNIESLPELTMCSCRCDGNQGSDLFCSCPEDYVCAPVIESLGVGDEALSGSFCLPK